MNNYPRLTWEFNDLSDNVKFMDLMITTKNGTISTSLFEKPLNLHLYIPPHSAHQPELLRNIVHRTLFQIFTLCSDHDDRILRTKVFSNYYMHAVTRVTKSNHSSTKQYPEPHNALDPQTLQKMTTLL